MKKNYRLLIFLIKSSGVLSFVWIALTVLVYFLFIDSTPAFQYYPELMFLYIFVVFFLYFLPVMLVTKNQFKKINGILFMDCDPLSYNDIYFHIIDEMSRTPKSLDYYRLNLSAGLIAAGRYNEAYESLIKFRSFKNNRVGKLSNIVYYNNLCSVCQKLGRTDEAKYYSDCLAGCMTALSPKDHNKYSKYADLARYSINTANGNFDNAENFYNEVFDKAANNYERTGAKFCLGKVHLHFGDTGRAKEAFECVASYGNKLHIVEEAKEFLSQLT